MKKIVRLITILLLCSQTIFAQYNRFDQKRTNHFTDKKNYFNFGKIFHSEIHYLPYKKDSIKSILLFRLSYDLLNFEKYPKHRVKNEMFFAVPTVEAEFEDKEGIIRKRIVWQDTIFTQNFDKTISKSDFIKGKVVTITPEKNYTVTVRLSDKNNRNIKKMILKDTLSHNYLSDNIIEKPIFVYSNNMDMQNFLPYISSNNINFSSKYSVILIPVSYSDKFVKYFYQCNFIKQKVTNSLEWNSDFNISGLLVPKKNSTIKIGDNLEITLPEFKTNTNYNTGVIAIPLPIEEIVPGNYQLKFVQNNSLDTLQFNFKVIWEDMPLVLSKLKLAIQSMYYILTDKEYETMLDADKDDYSKEILKYWKKENPSKSTPYNKAMAEYFKRVDYAIFNFQTFTQKNGMKTDKGKIYILYGEPSDISKDFKGQETYEIWKYTRLKKEFVFIRSSDDKYKLVDIKKNKE